MNKKTRNITISSEFITLGQLLKLSDLIKSGGEAKIFLSSNKVIVNGENESRRGRKLRKNDIIVVNDEEIIIK